MNILRPKIVVVVGTPASGKTKLGRRIARDLKLAVSDKDHVTGQLLKAIMADAGFDSEDYSQTSLNRYREAIYGCMEDVAKDNLNVGMGTVIISPYADRGDEGWLERLKFRVDPEGLAEWFVVWVRITPEDALGRVTARNSPRDVIKLRDWEGFVGSTFWGAPSCNHLAVEAMSSLESKKVSALAYIEHGGVSVSV